MSAETNAQASSKEPRPCTTCRTVLSVTTQRGKVCLTSPCICSGSLGSFHYPCHARSVPATRMSTLAGCRTMPLIHENLVQSARGGRTPCTWMEMSKVVTRYCVMLVRQAKLRVDVIHKTKPMPLLRITRDSVGGLGQILGTQSLRFFGRTYARSVGRDGGMRLLACIVDRSITCWVCLAVFRAPISRPKGCRIE